MMTTRNTVTRGWQWTVSWTLALSIFVLAGCAALPRREAPPTLFSGAAPVGFSSEVRFLSTDLASVESHSAVGLQRLRNASKDGIVRALVLSGGGAGGAYGAGALIGLSRAHERPQYDLVTGVSAGALIAPFAFLGPEWDSQLTDAFTIGADQRMSLNGLLAVPFGVRRRTAALNTLVDHYVTSALIKAVAQEAAKGRLLWVATTDLDKEETVIWDLGAIAARGGEPARRLFRDVLVASASVPGVFSPVLIHVQEAGVSYDEMHIDGNASTSLFIAPVAAYFALLDPHSLEGTRIYVLINGRIIDAPETTPLRLAPIVSRTLSAALRHMASAQVIAVDQFAEKYRMSVQSTYLPFDYPQYSSTDFRATAMQPLFAYGEQCAERGRLWTTIGETMANAETAAMPSKRISLEDQNLQCPVRSVEFATAAAP
jgi:predicted acylesterase/phospholipase RssA